MEEQKKTFVEPELIKYEERLADITAGFNAGYCPADDDCGPA
jgi:hypothetical protein